MKGLMRRNLYVLTPLLMLHALTALGREGDLTTSFPLRPPCVSRNNTFDIAHNGTNAWYIGTFYRNGYRLEGTNGNLVAHVTVPGFSNGEMKRLECDPAAPVIWAAGGVKLIRLDRDTLAVQQTFTISYEGRTIQGLGVSSNEIFLLMNGTAAPTRKLAVFNKSGQFLRQIGSDWSAYSDVVPSSGYLWAIPNWQKGITVLSKLDATTGELLATFRGLNQHMEGLAAEGKSIWIYSGGLSCASKSSFFYHRFVGMSTSQDDEPRNEAPRVKMDVQLTFATVGVPCTIPAPLYVWDDGLPLTPGRLAFQWTLYSGPQPVTYNDSSLLTPTITFSAPGVYHFEVRATDGEYSGYDVQTIYVKPTPAEQPTVTILSPAPADSFANAPRLPSGELVPLRFTLTDPGRIFPYLQVWVKQGLYGNSVFYQKIDSPGANYSYSNDVLIADGPYTIEVYAPSPLFESSALKVESRFIVGAPPAKPRVFFVGTAGSDSPQNPKFRTMQRYAADYSTPLTVKYYYCRQNMSSEPAWLGADFLLYDGANNPLPGTGTVTFAAGEDTVRFRIEAVDDNMVDPSKYSELRIDTSPDYDIALAEGGGATIAGETEFEIQDRDQSVFQVNPPKDASIWPGERALIGVERVESSVGPGLAVDLPILLSGTAIRGVDYDLLDTSGRTLSGSVLSIPAASNVWGLYVQALSPAGAEQTRDVYIEFADTPEGHTVLNLRKDPILVHPAPTFDSVEPVRVETNQITLQWQDLGLRFQYAVQACTSLCEGVWQDVVPAPTNASWEGSLPPGTSTMFYRIQARRTETPP